MHLRALSRNCVLYGHPLVREEMENQRIQWRFYLEMAPWWGRIFERMVGSIKRCIRTVLGNASVFKINCRLSHPKATFQFVTPTFRWKDNKDRPADRVGNKGNICRNFWQYYAEESDDYAEKMPDYTEISKIKSFPLFCFF